ncbi:MAG: hypothetical protein H6739_05830 [Alphaproteobacteria bacterium]|nr:hypothetical protein [Alphaproteobacteria bacterium]
MSLATLTLSPEFGGTTFGPFQPAPIALGSDSRRCQIVLSPQLGVRPVHCYVTPNGDGSFTLQLGEAGVGLYYYVRARGQAQPVRSVTRLQTGDAFALGSPGGPRFVLGIYQEAPAPGVGGKGRRGLPTAGQMGAEVKRQMSTELHRNKITGALQTYFYRLSSGAYFQPRYILAGAVAVFGILATGCAGLLRLVAELAGGGS